MKKILSIITGVILTAISILSCEDNYTICNEPKDVSFKGAFFKKVGAADVESAVSFLTVKPLTDPAFIYNLQPNVSSFAFSLNPSLDSAKYIFKIDNSSKQDTVTLFYSSQSKVLSEPCGTITIHLLSNSRSTKNVLDSVKVIDTKVDNLSNVNLKIYFH